MTKSYRPNSREASEASLCRIVLPKRAAEKEEASLHDKEGGEKAATSLLPEKKVSVRRSHPTTNGTDGGGG